MKWQTSAWKIVAKISNGFVRGPLQKCPTSCVKRCIIIDQVGLRICLDPNRQKLEHQGSHGHTLCAARRLVRRTARTRELNALKGERKGFKAQCFHCGQHGHRLSAYQKKDADIMKGKGKMKGFSEGKNPPQ